MLLRAELFSALALTIGIALIVQGCATGSTGGGTMGAQTGGAVSFAGQIAPIFEARCTECHGGTDPESGLNLSTYASAIAGSEFGTVIEQASVHPDGNRIAITADHGSSVEVWAMEDFLPKTGGGEPNIVTP